MDFYVPDKVSKFLGHRTLRNVSWIGLALLVAISGLSYWSTRQYLRSAEWREHSDVVLAQLTDIQISLARAEAAQNAFVITGQPELLKNFAGARDVCLQQLSSLKLFVEDNPEQVKILSHAQGLIQDELRDLNKLGEMVEAHRLKEAHDFVWSGATQALMKRVGADLQAFESAERLLLKGRVSRAEQDFRVAGSLAAAGLSLAFLMLLAVTSLLQRELARRAKIEAALIKAKQIATEASEMKSSFLANMSHEIRTPLNGILGMAKLLENSSLTNEQRDFISTMKVSSNSLMALINQILDFSKIESGKLQLEEAPFEFESLVTSTVSVVEYSARSKGLRIEKTIAPAVPRFFIGDALRIRQVLLNLLNNAIKFSDRGVVSLRITELRTWDSRAEIQIEVIDQGIGLDVATKDRLFRVFSQGDESTSRKYGGSGLGLAISKQIVEMMDGKIDVESVPGVGTRLVFSLILKISKFREELTPQEATAMRPMALGAHILIAEDNRINQKVVMEMIRLLGCTAKVAADGVGVLDALRAERFDLVLMDGQMSEMDGYEATRLIREGQAGERAKQIPIVATTANAIRGDIEKCLGCGMNDYVGKPISYDDLAYKVEKWLRRGSKAIDVEVIKKVVALGAVSDGNLLQSLIELFVQDGAAGFLRLRVLLESRDTTAVSKTAHVLKSSSANLGALRLRDLLERLEKAKPDTDVRHLALLIDAAEREYRSAVVELHEIGATASPSSAS